LSDATVNKVGRPSKAREQKLRILLATGVVVARDGLAAMTVGNVAEEAGLQRTLVFHYFRDRQELLDAFLDEMVALYGDVQSIGDRTRTIEERIDRSFDDDFYASRGHLVVWAELVALGGRDSSFRLRLRSLWLDRWLPLVETQLREARPHAPRADVSRVAYAISLLVEAYWSLRLQGVESPVRKQQARQTARLVVAGLGPATPDRERVKAGRRAPSKPRLTPNKRR
jgi:AcrR family transcriptional regulator